MHKQANKAEQYARSQHLAADCLEFTEISFPYKSCSLACDHFSLQISHGGSASGLSETSAQQLQGRKHGELGKIGTRYARLAKSSTEEQTRARRFQASQIFERQVKHSSSCLFSFAFRVCIASE